MLQQCNWPEAVIAAEAAREPFEDVLIKTTRSVFLETAMKVAAEAMHKEGITLESDSVNTAMCMMIAARKVHVQECVIVNESGITVCIDAPTTDRDDVMWKALDLVAQALDQLDQKHGTVYFGEPLFYSMSDLH